MEKTSPSLAAYYDFIFRIDKRINTLEKDTVAIERRIAIIENMSNQKYSGLEQDIKQIESMMMQMKSDLKNCIFEMINITKQLRTAVKKDQINQLNQRLDDTKIEEYVTKKDLDRGF